MLLARNLSWQQNGKNILRDVSLHLTKGEWVGLIGPNGSGKSSLLKILSRLESPTQGSLLFQEQEISRRMPLELRRKIAVVFQESLLLDTTVYDNVAMGLKLRGMSGKELSQRVELWLERFGISHLAKQNSHSLSGGEAQRASLARAFVLEPAIIFLDEPFSALDAPTKEALVEDLAEIFESTNTTAMLVSHDFRDIQRLTSRTLIMLNGQVAAEGSPSELLHTSHSAAVEVFLSHWRNLETGQLLSSPGIS
jgi:tungstate transport system ATP-binding protein